MVFAETFVSGPLLARAAWPRRSSGWRAAMLRSRRTSCSSTSNDAGSWASRPGFGRSGIPAQGGHQAGAVALALRGGLL